MIRKIEASCGSPIPPFGLLSQQCPSFRLKSSSFFRKGFSLVEILVAVLVFSIFVGTLIYLYQWISHSFRATNWKQDRTREAEEFWNFLRRNLEEAANIHQEDVTGDLNVDPRPLHARSLPSIPEDGSADGDLMAWVRARMNPVTRTPEYALGCHVRVQKRKVFMSIKSLGIGPIPPGETVPDRALLNDVSGFVIQMVPIRQDPSAGDYADTGSTGIGAIVATQVEVSVLFEPGGLSGLSNLRLAQNHKFRVAVDHVVESSGVISFAY